jgi:hypothetical protein
MSEDMAMGLQRYLSYLNGQYSVTATPGVASLGGIGGSPLGTARNFEMVQKSRQRGTTTEMWIADPEKPQRVYTEEDVSDETYYELVETLVPGGGQDWKNIIVDVGHLGSENVTGTVEPISNVCEAMADIAQAFANEALRNNSKNYKAAVREFDDLFSTFYAGRPMRTTRDLWTAFLFGVNLRRTPELRGDTGFKCEFIDGEGDQTHHFAAMFSAGINAAYMTSTAFTYVSDLWDRNWRDMALTRAAYPISLKVATRPSTLNSIGYIIRRDICRK